MERMIEKAPGEGRLNGPGCDCWQPKDPLDLVMLTVKGSPMWLTSSRMLHSGPPPQGHATNLFYQDADKAAVIILMNISRNFRKGSSLRDETDTDKATAWMGWRGPSWAEGLLEPTKAEVRCRKLGLKTYTQDSLVKQSLGHDHRSPKESQGDGPHKTLKPTATIKLVGSSGELGPLSDEPSNVSRAQACCAGGRSSSSVPCCPHAAEPCFTRRHWHSSWSLLTSQRV